MTKKKAIKWFGPPLVTAAMGIFIMFVSGSAVMKSHTEDQNIHKGTDELNALYMPREVIEEKLDRINESLERIEEYIKESRRN